MRFKFASIVAMLFVGAARIAVAGDAASDQTQDSGPPAQSGDTSAQGTSSQDTPSSDSTPCVDVEIGGDRSAYLDCLNKQMQQGTEREHEIPQPAAPLDAQSPSNRVGTANDAAAREKMGNAFGKTAVPQRPNPVFVNPVVPSH